MLEVLQGLSAACLPRKPQQRVSSTNQHELRGHAPSEPLPAEERCCRAGSRGWDPKRQSSRGETVPSQSKIWTLGAQATWKLQMGIK